MKFCDFRRILMAPFSDEFLYVEIAIKALFWQQQNYYGVDLTPLYGSAFQGYFGQSDPFNCSYLTQDMLIPVVDLKARIGDFVRSQELKKQGHGLALDMQSSKILEGLVRLPENRVCADCRNNRRFLWLLDVCILVWFNTSFST